MFVIFSMVSDELDGYDSHGSYLYTDLFVIRPDDLLIAHLLTS